MLTKIERIKEHQQALLDKKVELEKAYFNFLSKETSISSHNEALLEKELTEKRAEFVIIFIDLLSEKQNMSIHEKAFIGIHHKITKELLKAAKNNEKKAEEIADLVHTQKDPQNLDNKRKKLYLLSSAFALSEKTLENLAEDKLGISLLLNQQACGLLGSYTGYTLKDLQQLTGQKQGGKASSEKLQPARDYVIEQYELGTWKNKQVAVYAIEPKLTEFMAENSLFNPVSTNRHKWISDLLGEHRKKQKNTSA